MEITQKKPRVLWLLSGIPGAGKDSYLAAAKIPEEYIVSRDEIRMFMLNAEDEYFDKEKEVFNEYVAAVQRTLDKYGVCYANATHLNEKSRNKLISRLHDVTEINAIVFCVPVEDALIRNAKREGRARVPDSAIMRMYDSMTHPKYDKSIKYGYIMEVYVQ